MSLTEKFIVSTKVDDKRAKSIYAQTIRKSNPSKIHKLDSWLHIHTQEQKKTRTLWCNVIIAFITSPRRDNERAKIIFFLFSVVCSTNDTWRPIKGITSCRSIFLLFYLTFLFIGPNCVVLCPPICRRLDCRKSEYWFFFSLLLRFLFTLLVCVCVCVCVHIRRHCDAFDDVKGYKI